MTHPRRIRASKRAVNVSVDSNLVPEARELGIPLSGTLETALRSRVKEERDRR
jgi:post-segregation antitoxin (ccd killing protein)